MQEEKRCTICKGPWHPATGFIVGRPLFYRACGACWKNEILPLIKERLGLKIRFSRRGDKKYIRFYDYV